ncbi:MAG: hemerythrin domain-containing protein [Chitinispirillaceae bacterium]|nr:hemerythrin domain-containing protein [Chitinispirillaceae bacterium]
MQPRGPLMVEHRLIERMISLIDKEVKRIEKTNEVNLTFIDTAVDFIRMYADRTHHGKEEEILFRDLSKKTLSDNDAVIMNELIKEHTIGRAATAELVTSAAAYQKGERAALPLIITNLRKFVVFYPEHIEKEDKVFFPSCMKYLSESEKQSMLNEFWEFDRKMIHFKYQSVVESIEKQMSNQAITTTSSFSAQARK